MSNHPTPEQLPVEVQSGQWTDVQKGMMPAIGVKPHPDQETYPGILILDGVTRDDGSPVIVTWHNRGCKRIGIKPEHVRFDINGAPWCPTCFAENEFRDPAWNQPKDTSGVATPIPQGVIDQHDSNGGRAHSKNRAHERNQDALRTGRFRDPQAVRDKGHIGDDGAPVEKPWDGQINPPERFDG